jgi:hypothetical protein
MRWRKLGRIFCSEGQFPWMASHAGAPFAEQIEGDLYRIYFTSRDRANRSHVGWIEIDITRPSQVLRVSETPLLAPGPSGAFDDAGTTLSWIINERGRRCVYYIGWSLRSDVPYHLAIGLAVGDVAAGTPSVERVASPVLDRIAVDPLFCTAPCLLVEDDHWRMWYVSGTGWTPQGGRIVPSYRTCYATSDDGIDWRRDGRVVLAPEGDELGFSRGSVLRDSGGYVMWYAVRRASRPYRLGFARSPDGLSWERDDSAAGLDVSADGWDSQMITYPHVFDHGGDRYMLYCGNDYGLTGFGLALLC